MAEGSTRTRKANGEQKQVAGRESDSDKIPAIRECDKDRVIQQFEEIDDRRKNAACVSEETTLKWNRRCKTF